MNPLFLTIKREFHRLGSRTVYVFGMVVVPVAFMLFLLSLMSNGLPLGVPVAVVDLDHSALSRELSRSLNDGELTDVCASYESYNDALAAMRRGDIYGFFIIPQKFEEDAVAGREPSVDFYSNLTYFIPGTLTYKSFRTMAVMTSAGMVKTQLIDMGATDEVTAALIEPMTFQEQAPGNPWTNYAYYLAPSFCFALLALMICIISTYSITMEIKSGSSRQWMLTAGGSVVTAVSGKLLPQTLIFTCVGWLFQSIMYGYCHFPCAGNVWVLFAAMPMFVIANQAFGLFFSSMIPNPRLAMSVVSLLCILTFSFAGFSFPVEDMYGVIGIFSYIVPVRYFFMLIINEALFGAPLYYSRLFIMALLLFPVVAMTALPLLKRALKNPVYIP